MSDKALANAERTRDGAAAKINQLQQQLDEARRDLSAAENFIKEWHRFAGAAVDTKSPVQEHSTYPQNTQDAEAKSGPNNGPFIVRPRPAALRNPDRAIVGLNAKAIIIDEKRPISRQELFQKLAARGIRIQGKDPEMVLSTMMWRMKDEFVRLPGSGYWIRELPWAPANYVPGADEPQAEDIDIFPALNEPDEEAAN